VTGVRELDAASQAVGPDEEVAEDEDEGEEMGKDDVDDEVDEGDAVAAAAAAEEAEEAQGAAFDREPAAEPVKSSSAITPSSDDITPSFFHNFQHLNPAQLPAPEPCTTSST